MPSQERLQRFDRTLYRPIRTDAFREAVYDVLRIGRRSVVDRSSRLSLPAPTTGRPSQPARVHDGERPRILVAEDNETNQQLTAGMLDYLGFETELVPDGKAAVDRVRQGNFSAVLMDCQMPVMDGYSATRCLREEGHVTLPIVALTAHAGASHEKAALDAGMNAYLTKPVRLEALERVLTEVRAQAPTPANDVGPAEGAACCDSEASEQERAIIDMKVIDTLRSLESPSNPNLTARLVERFVSSAAEYRDHLHGALENGDVHGLRESAHALKGASASLGACRLAFISQQLEQHAGDLDLESCRTPLGRLDSALDEACSVLQDLIQRPRDSQADAG